LSAVATLREDDLIAAIRRLLDGASNARVRVGIGDDAAVWQPSRSHRSVITSDALIEGVHFNRSWMNDREIGVRAMIANVSDLAAMGARPVLGTVALGFPKAFAVDDVLELYRGMLAVAGQVGLAIVGGDLTRAPVLTISIAVVGEVRQSNLKLRSGARAGDAIVTTGMLGASRAGLDLLRGRITLEAALAQAALLAYRTPQVRLREGLWLAASANVHAMIDCSDGLSTDLGRLCAASNVGAAIVEVPIAPAAAAAARALGTPETDYALAGGEDFELIAAVAPRALTYLTARFRARFGRQLYRIGEIRAGTGLQLRIDDRDVSLAVTGYDHFGE